MKNNLICIYHKDCNDGFAAALAVHTWADQKKQPCEFIPAHYGDNPPDVTGKHVMIVDFSYSRDILIDMHNKADNLLVIDHHKTAEADLKDLDFCIFDQSKCGAVLTWSNLFPNQSLPLLFRYIQDRDLWQWQLYNSRAISAALSILPKEFSAWNKYLADDDIGNLTIQGNIILNYQNQCIKKMTDPSDISIVNIAGHTVPCINTTHLISETGNELAKNHPFCALYFETADQRIYSLRSAKNGIDVSEIAKKYGGGGHTNAAGFKIPKPKVNLNDPTELLSKTRTQATEFDKVSANLI